MIAKAPITNGLICKTISWNGVEVKENRLVQWRGERKNGADYFIYGKPPAGRGLF
jgi:hypothetical protein